MFTTDKLNRETISSCSLNCAKVHSLLSTHFYVNFVMQHT